VGLSAKKSDLWLQRNRTKCKEKVGLMATTITHEKREEKLTVDTTKYCRCRTEYVEVDQIDTIEHCELLLPAEHLSVVVKFQSIQTFPKE
jgi:hypothetical protein